jgi:hypothetical protein
MDVFGANRVHVLLFEEFVRNENGFLEDLSGILGVGLDEMRRLVGGDHENRRGSNRQFRYVRFRDKFLRGLSLRRVVPFGDALQRRFAEFLASGGGINTKVPDDWRGRLSDYYRTGNANLSFSHNLSLEKYGYPI